MPLRRFLNPSFDCSKPGPPKSTNPYPESRDPEFLGPGMSSSDRSLGRDWMCMWCKSGGSGGGGGAGWHALRREGETSTNTVCLQDCQEWCVSPTFITGQSRQGQPPPRMFCLLSRAANVRARAYAHGRVRVCVCVCACIGLHEPHHSVISTRDHHRSSGDLVL